MPYSGTRSSTLFGAIPFGAIPFGAIPFATFGVYVIFELGNYIRYNRRFDRFNRLRCIRQTRDELGPVADSIIAHTPDLYSRGVGIIDHVIDRETLIDVIHPGGPYINSPHIMTTGRTSLHRQYRSVVTDSIVRSVYWIGSRYMSLSGWTTTIYPTEIGDYTIRSHIVEGTKPIIFFPGFGLGTIPYNRVARLYNRTVHLIELPNLGYETSDAPGYVTPESLYGVIRRHMNGVPHDVIAHSIGTSAAAMYLNQQYTTDTEDPAQTMIFCDGFVSPVDTILSHNMPFADIPTYDVVYRDTARYRPSRAEFCRFIRLLVYNFNLTVYTKRFHDFYNGTAWRSDYKTRVRFLYGGREMLYDVAYIQKTVDAMPISTRKKYVFVPEARHGSCFFGRRRDATIRLMAQMMQE